MAKMTPEQLAQEQREFLIRTEKESAVVVLAEFEILKKNISQYLTANLTGRSTVSKLYENSFLEKTLDEIEIQIERIKNPFARIITRGQQQVINFASVTLQKFLNVKTSIFLPDREAIQKLIGRTQSGTTLARIFQRLKPAAREIAKKEFIEGFAIGEPVQMIAKRLSGVADVARHRALTISRTETNEAYRAASREFYAEADIKEYIWCARLSARTCLICWHLHGRKFKTSVKVFSHLNCGCVLIPRAKNQTPLATGASQFSKLEGGFQKQILGTKRFELFQSGTEFNNFVGASKSEEFGERYFVKNLSEFSSEKD